MTRTEDLDACNILLGREVYAQTLNEWEAVFLESLRDRLEDGQTLTLKQREKFEELWGEIVVRRGRE